jgi:general secretion pathway protein A
MDNNPFTTAVNPNHLYITPSLGRTLDKVRYVVDSRQGLTVIYGAVGLGKSTVMRYLTNEFEARDDCQAVFLPNPDYRSDLAFLKAICGELRLPMRRSQLDQQSELRKHLIGLYGQEKNCIVLLDEAQVMKGPLLELVRSLLNFESNTHKLINIVLCGQIELHAKLADPSKAALRSRIILYSNLDPLSLEETQAMLQFRSDRAHIKNPFAPELIEVIYAKSKGVPREILKHAGAAYHIARANKLTEVPMKVLEMILPDVNPPAPQQVAV